MPQKLISDGERIWVRLAIHDYAVTYPRVVVAALRKAILARGDVPTAISSLDYGQFYSLLQGALKQLVKQEWFEIAEGEGVHRKGIKTFVPLRAPDEDMRESLLFLASSS